MLTISVQPIQVPIQAKSWQPVRFAPARYRVGQEAPPAAPATTTAEPSAAAPAKKAISDPALLILGALGGGLVGYLLTLGAPKILKNFPRVNSALKTSGAVGGAVGAALGIGATLLLKK